MDIIERLKSPIVWAGVITQIALIITLYSADVANEFKIVATSVVEMATLFGFLNNPTERDKF